MPLFWEREGIKIILFHAVIIRTRMASLTKESIFKFFGLWVMVIGRGTFLLHLGCPVDNCSVFFMYKD